VAQTLNWGDAAASREVRVMQITRLCVWLERATAGKDSCLVHQGGCYKKAERGQRERWFIRGTGLEG